MEESSVARLRAIAALLAVVVAGIHLLHPSQGGAALLVYAQVGYLGDPRPLAFTLGAFALISGVLLGYNGFHGRWLYLGGIGVTLSLLLGFVAWHTVLGHGGFWPYLEVNQHTHQSTLAVVWWHVANDPTLLVSKLAELALLSCLVALLRFDA